MTFNLTELNEFPADLILQMQPESSIQRLVDHSDKMDDTLYYESMQYVDYFNAYIYAQNEILTKARLHGIASITQLEWLEHILNINRHMAKTTLAANATKAGEYETAERFIWNFGQDMEEEIEEEIFKNPNLNIPSFSRDLAAKYNAPLADIQNFLELIIPSHLDSSGMMSSNALDFIKNYKSMASVIIDNFKNNYNEQQKLTVLKIARPICNPDIHNSIMDLVKNLHAKLQDIPQESSDKALIAAIVAEFGLDLMLIHPFANANGRTALCLMNTLFTAFNLPSITFGNYAEVNDYNYPFFQIITSPIPNNAEFTSFILQRLSINQFRNPHTTPAEMQKLIELRIEFCTLYKQVKNSFPSFNVDIFHAEKMMSFEEQYWPKVYERLSSEEKATMNNEKFTNHFFTYSINALKEHRDMLSASHINLSIYSTTYNVDEWLEIKDKLIDITRVADGWKVYKKNSTILFTPNDQSQLRTVLTTLRNLNFGNVTHSHIRNAPEQELIKITNIDLEKLRRVEIVDDSKSVSLTI